MVALLLIMLGAGLGMLLDFWILNVHPLFSIGMVLPSIPASHYWAVRRTLSMDSRFNADYVRNLALATVAGQAGCVSVVLIFAGLFAGMFLDARLDTHPIFTIALVLISVPVSLYAMIRLMLSSVSAIRHPPPMSADTPAENGAEDLLHHKENGS